MSVQIGIIGSGNITKQHLTGLSKMDDVKIAAFCDVVEERSKEMAAAHGAKSYTNAEAMFSENKLDAVWICLPPFAHGDAERQALAHKVPFFVEKPVGMDRGALREIAAEVQKTGLLTSVGYMNRYRASVQRGRELLQNDPPVLAYGAWIGKAPSRPGHWWTQKDKSGGQLVEQTTHTVDLARYLCGDAAEVFAYATKGFNPPMEGYSIDDASTVAVQFKNGAVVNLMSACACATGGGVFLNVHAANTCLRYTGWEHSVTIEQAGKDPEKITGEADIFVLEDQQFVKAVQTGDRSLIRCDYPDGLKTAELTLAANESMATGKAVRV